MTKLLFILNEDSLGCISYGFRNSTIWYADNYYFFGSCDLCAQAMDLDDANFKNLYRSTLTYIGMTDLEINNVFEMWMLDKFSEKELLVIKHGARCFREFENNPEGVDGLRFCFTKFSNNSKQSND